MAVPSGEGKARDCSTCARWLRGRCAVLTDHRYPWERHGGCWAWTDNPEWARKVRRAVEAYQGRSGAAGR